MSLSAAQINSIYAALFGPTYLPSNADVAYFTSLDTNTALSQIVNSALSAQYDFPIVRIIEFVSGVVPNAAQLQGWASYLESGGSLTSVVNAFASGSTFQNVFNNGNPVNVNAPPSFTVMYNLIVHALGTTPTTQQVNTWLATGLSTSQLLAQFANGDQYSARTDTFVQNYLTHIAAGAAGIPGATPPVGSLFAVDPLITITDSGSTTAGAAVTFTITETGLPPGTMELWQLSGTAVTGNEISGATSGMFAFDATGHATVTVHTVYQSIGDTTLTLALTDPTVPSDLVALTAPVIENFTAKVGETLVGPAQGTIFSGVVDTEVVNNNTLSNVVDVAMGDASVNNTEWIIIDSTATQEGSAHKTIVPASSGVQTFEFTNNDDYGSYPSELCCDETPSDATWIDGTFMHDVTAITSFASTHDTLIYNLQNFIDTITISESDAPGALYLGLIMRDTVHSGGTQTINLLNSGEMFLEDETTSDFSVVGQFDINSHNDNPLTPNILHIDGMEIATTIVVTDGGSSDTTEIFSCDDTEALTTVDATGTAGTFVIGGIEASDGNNLSIFEGTGNDTEYVAVEGDNGGYTNPGSLSIYGTSTSGSGSSTANVFLQDGGGQTIFDSQPNNNNDALYVNVGGSEFSAGDTCDDVSVTNDCPDNVTVTATMGNGNDVVSIASLSNPLGSNAAITVNLGTGNDCVSSYSGDSSNVSITANSVVGTSDHVKVWVGNQSTVLVNTGAGDDVVCVNAEEQSAVTINAGNGENWLTINTQDGGVLACTSDQETNDEGVDDGDGHQTYVVTAGSGTDHLTITPGGSDPTYSPGGPVDEGVDDTGLPTKNPNGEPDSMIAQFQNITVNLGDGGTALDHQTANIETGHDSTVNYTSGNGWEDVTILANNSIWTGGDDNGNRTGVGGSIINVNSGNGTKTFFINTDNEGEDFEPAILDNGSQISLVAGAGNDLVTIIAGTNATINETLNSVAGNVTNSTITIPDTWGGLGHITVVTGAGNDNVVIHGSDGQIVNVSLGAGDDRVQIHSLGAGITLDGGSDNQAFNPAKPGIYTGGDTLATWDSAFASGVILGSVMHFENLEIVDTMTNNIDAQSLGALNDINHVILDQGYNGPGIFASP